MKYLLILCLLISQFSFGQKPRLVGEKIFKDYSLFEENGKIGLVYIGERIVRDGDFDYFIQLPATFDTIIEEFDFFKCYTGETFRLYDPEFDQFIFADYDLTWLGTFKQKHFYAAEIRTEKGRGILNESQREILVPPEFDDITFIDYFENQLLFKAEKNGVGFLYLDSILIDNLLIDEVERIDESSFLKVTNKNKVGLYLIHSKRNSENNESQVTEILPVNFSKIDVKELEEVGGDYLISADKQKGILFWEGPYTRWIVPMEYEEINLKKKTDINSGNIVSVKDLSGKEGYLFYEDSWEPIHPVFIKDYKVAGDRYLLFKHESGKWGVIATYSGSVGITVPAEYDQILIGEEAGTLNEFGLAVVRKGNKWGAITLDNEIMAEIKFDEPSDIVLD